MMSAAIRSGLVPCRWGAGGANGGVIGGAAAPNVGTPAYASAPERAAASGCRPCTARPSARMTNDWGPAGGRLPPSSGDERLRAPGGHRRAHLVGARKSLRGVEAHRAVDERGEPAGQIGPNDREGGRRHHRSRHGRLHRRRHAVRRRRREPARDRVVHGRADREDIGPRVDRCAARLLRRHVRGRPDHLPVRRHRSGIRLDLRDAEVEQLHEIVRDGRGGEEHVVRLDVAMNDACAMGGGERGQDLRRDERDAGIRHGPLLLDHVAEGRSLEELHHEKGRTVAWRLEVRVPARCSDDGAPPPSALRGGSARAVGRHQTQTGPSARHAD